MKKDDYLQQLIQIPPKQKISIVKFDTKTQREAFAVSLEGLKGWNINSLVSESTQAREDRKKRKEMKRLAKAQLMGASAASAYSPGAPNSTSVSTPGPTQIGARPILSVTPSGQTSSTAAPPFANTNVMSHNEARPPGHGFSKVRTPVPGASPSTPRSGMTPTMNSVAIAGQKRAGVSAELARPAKKPKMESGSHGGSFERSYEMLQQPTPQDS